MNREQTKQLLAILQTAYPKFYANQKLEEMQQTVNLWYAALQHCEFESEIKPALKILVQSLKFPPTIADMMQAVQQTKEEPLDEMAENDRLYRQKVSDWHKRKNIGPRALSQNTSPEKKGQQSKTFV